MSCLAEQKGQTWGTFAMSTRSGRVTQSPSSATSRLIKTASGHTGDLQLGRLTGMQTGGESGYSYVPEENNITSRVLEETYAQLVD